MLYLKLHYSKDLRSFNKIIIPGLPRSVFHENNCQSSPFQSSKFNTKRELLQRGPWWYTDFIRWRSMCWFIRTYLDPKKWGWMRKWLRLGWNFFPSKLKASTANNVRGIRLHIRHSDATNKTSSTNSSKHHLYNVNCLNRYVKTPKTTPLTIICIIQLNKMHQISPAISSCSGDMERPDSRTMPPTNRA